MSCPTLWDGLRVNVEHLGTEIHSIPSPATPFFNFVKRGTFTKNTGVNHTTFIAGRIEPTSKSAGWSDISFSGTGGLAGIAGAVCQDTYTDVPVGFTEKTFAPRKLSLKGPPICKDQITFTHNPMGFIQGHYVPSLANYVKRKIDLEFRDQTIKLGNKLSIVSSALSNSGAYKTGLTLPTVAPTSQLNWDWLDKIAATMISAGATNADEAQIELGPDGPVFPIFIGLEMLNRLTTNVPAIRGDFQYAFEGKGEMAMALKAIGASRQIKNYRFAPVTHPPRYNHTGGILVEVDAFEDSALTHGTGQVEAAAYTNAEYEAAIIPHIQQWQADVVTPDNAGLNFDVSNWSGDWDFITGANNMVLNGGTACFDPRHKWGAHFSEYVYAPEPIHTQFGWTLIFKRCQNDQAVTACTSGL